MTMASGKAVRFAARCVQCPICKEACVNPVRPKNCPHRYCMKCFRKCFQDKQEKHCATCRTPILSVSKRGFTEDELFAKVVEIVPGIRDEESDDDVDIAEIMARQRQQAERIRREAEAMRSGVKHTPRPAARTAGASGQAAAPAPARVQNVQSNEANGKPVRVNTPDACGHAAGPKSSLPPLPPRNSCPQEPASAAQTVAPDHRGPQDGAHQGNISSGVPSSAPASLSQVQGGPELDGPVAKRARLDCTPPESNA